MSLIDRQAAIDALDSIGSLDTDADREYAREVFEALPSARQDVPATNVGDLISRQEAKLKVARVIWEDGDSCYDFIDKCVDCLDALPPAQPDNSACWGCNCPKMEQKTFSEMVRLHDAERRTDGVDS